MTDSALYEGWLKYFLRAVRTSADDIVKRAWMIDSLLEECSNKIEEKLPRVRKNAHALLDQLCHTPIMSINDTSEFIGSTYNTAQKLINSFLDLEILKTENDKQRGKSYSFKKYLDILEREFEG